MAKIKLTKNELKKQKDSLKMFQRYLPTLMLKKQQLQAEIRTTENRVKELHAEKNRLDENSKAWIAVYGENSSADGDIFKPDMLKITEVKTSMGNIAGVPIPVFQGASFQAAPYDLVATPLWLDAAVERMQKVLLLDLEAKIVEEQQRLLEHELRVTTQRVNLFEKVKIPETKTNIKKINVFLGDQQTSAVVRGKISKKKIAQRDAVVKEAA
jgi:V/A-type H+-transporting ATPase subunit D